MSDKDDIAYSNGQTVPPAGFYQMEGDWFKKADLYKPAKSSKKNLTRIQQDILK